MGSGASNIDKYLESDIAWRFDFLYENFSILKPMIKSYREELILDVADMKAYNHRAQNGDLGVRVQVSVGTSRPTERQAISNISIAKAIDEGFLDETFFEGTDDRQELIRRVKLYHRVYKDYESFQLKLDTLRKTDQEFLKPYLMREKSLADLADELGITYRSAISKLYRIRKQLNELTTPRLMKGV